ncbi:MAG TPA: hypothetical protein DEP00_00680 [Lachnospiraceae bacterium]|nr:hypothetical protein [Lachnospiraceae bacterium]
MKKIRFTAVDFIRYLSIGAAVAVLMYMLKGHTANALPDALTTGALVLLVVSLWKTVRYLGFFDHTIYSFKKYFSIRRNKQFLDASGDGYVQYLKENKHTVNFLEPYAAFAVFLIGSLVLL